MKLSFACFGSFGACVVLGLLQGCSADVPARVQIPVVVDGRGGFSCTSNLDYAVELDAARIVVSNMQFTVGGAPHTAWHQRVRDFFVSTAYAHPEHELGGAAMGELAGRWSFDWTLDDGHVLGLADLEEAAYSSVNFDFARGEERDGLSVDDPLLGHTALLSGVAMRDRQRTSFVALVDSPLDRTLVGAPFQQAVTAQAPRAIGFRFSALDPLEGDCLFDDVDFHALRGASRSLTMIDDAQDVAASEAYNTLRRTFQTHDHFEYVARD